MTDPDRVDLVFTRKLLPLMRQSGMEITDLAREVRKQVHTLAASVLHEQTPAYYDGVLGKFCLAGCDSPADGASAGKVWLSKSPSFAGDEAGRDADGDRNAAKARRKR